MTAPTTFSVSPARCPLCGQDNACAMEQARQTGQEAGTCWCVTVQISPALIAQIPPQARNKACICAACVARGHQA